MHRLISTIGFVAGVTAAGATEALATTVQVVQPQVFVNRGDGYKPVAHTSGVAAGHIVMAAPNGSAKVVYDDGCVVEVKPGAVVTVYAGSPCPVGAAVNSAPRRGYIIAGVVVVAGVVGGVVALTGGGSDDDDNNAGKNALTDDDDDDGASP